MHLPVKTAIAAGIAGVAISMLGTGPATAAPAASPDFACHSVSTVCLYNGDRLDGGHLQIPVGGSGIQIDAPFNLLDAAGHHAGSVRNYGEPSAGDLWERDNATGAVHCTRSGHWASLGHRYGTGEFLTRAQSRGCREHAPSFGPNVALLREQYAALGFAWPGMTGHGINAKPRSSEVEICHATGHHHEAQQCISKEGADGKPNNGMLVETCDYRCPGKQRYGTVRWQMIINCVVGGVKCRPFKSPLANDALNGSGDAKFKYAGRESTSRFCLMPNITDARGGRMGIWGCSTFGKIKTAKFTSWVLWDVYPGAHAYHQYAMINVYASNADSDDPYWVASAPNEGEGLPIHVLSWGSVHEDYQIFDAFVALASH